MLTLDIDIDSAWPEDTDWAVLASRAAQAAANLVPELGHPRIEVSLIFTGDAEIRQLNHAWRGKDQATNVLSFPMLERGDLLALVQDGPPVLLGDIALACETCGREAHTKRVSVADHAAHLIIHGLLHLAGHDHERSPDDAEAMEALEIKALASLGIADPYAPGPHEGGQD